MPEPPRSCPLCLAPVRSRHAAQPGYRQGLAYEVFNCDGCGTAFVHPMEVDTAIYESIYAHSAELPGYNRYVRYADAVLGHAAPLDFLAESEDVYWSIRSCVQRFDPGTRILEVGCGLGYLTYALRQSGYDAIGMDISKVAVTEAEARYGSHYQEADLADWSVRYAEAYDLVIMTELIEHVPDPEGFLSMAAKLLRPGGSLLLTTPNKSYYPPRILWDTEPPPVHLWWFSEDGMRHLADRLGLKLHFVDFALFNRAHSPSSIWGMGQYRPNNGPKFDAQNRPLSREALRKTDREMRPSFYPLRKLARSLAKRLRSLRGQLGLEHRRSTLCAVLVKPMA